MCPLREYSFYRGRIDSCALGFAVPGSADDGPHMINATWYQDYTKNNQPHSSVEKEIVMIRRHPAHYPPSRYALLAAFFAFHDVV